MIFTDDAIYIDSPGPIMSFSIFINPVFCPICKEKVGEKVNTMKFDAELMVCSECNTERICDA